MSDALVYGRKVRILNVIDDYNREVLAIEPDFSLPAERVIGIMDQIVARRGKPQIIRVDNGPEYCSRVFVQWCEKNNIRILYIQPGKPMQNAYIERLNRTFREDVLDAYLFETLEEVRILSDDWQDHYNNYRPHTALKGKTPEMARKCLPAGSSFPKTIEQEQQNADQLGEKQSIFVKEE